MSSRENIVDILSQEVSSEADVREVLEAFANVVKTQLLAGEQVSVPGVGTLSLAKHAIRSAQRLDRINLIDVVAAPEFIESVADNEGRQVVNQQEDTPSINSLRGEELRRSLHG